MMQPNVLTKLKWRFLEQIWLPSQHMMRIVVQDESGACEGVQRFAVVLLTGVVCAGI